MHPIQYSTRNLSRGRPAQGVIINFDSVQFMDMIGLAGFDFVTLDAEHGPLTPGSVQGMIRAGAAAGMAVFVRTPGRDAFEIQRYLDIGAQGIQAPMIETKADTEEFVSRVFYPPEGHRGLSLTTPAGAYGAGDSAADHMRRVNAAIAAYATVESAKGVENIEAIVAVPGLAGVCIGTGDMAVSYGIPGQRGAPQIQQAVRRIIAACKAAKKQVMLPANDSTGAISALELGVTGIQFPAGAIVIERGKQMLAEIEAAPSLKRN